MTTATQSAAIQAAQHFVPLELETRPTVETSAYCHYLHIAEQTARAQASKGTGPIRPLKIGNRLHWPTAAIRELLGVTA